MRSEIARRALLVAIAVAPASCLLDWDSLRQSDGGMVDAAEDLGPAPDVSKPDAGNDANDAAPPCKLDLVVNELQADGPLGASDEFVELRNGASCGGSLLDWSLAYSSAGGSSPNALWTGQAGDSIGPQGPNGYVILGGFAFVAPDGGALIGRISNSLTGSLSKNGGGVGLFDPNGKLVDSVAYETLSTATHPFLRPADAGAGGGAPNPPSGESIARKPDGLNTNTNATDFQIASSPTPGAPN